MLADPIAGIQEILTARQSPWQKSYPERFIGSIRRECLNHYIILNARHIKKTLSSYFRYYHESRTHLSLDKQCPFPREAVRVGVLVICRPAFPDRAFSPETSNRRTPCQRSHLRFPMPLRFLAF